MLRILIFLALLHENFKKWRKQKKCDHPSFWEDRSCHAHCCKCDAELGFVDISRKAGRKEVLMPMSYYPQGLK